MTDDIVIKTPELPLDKTSEIVVEKNTVVSSKEKPNEKYSYENTIWRGRYWYAGYPISLFVNYNIGGHESFSFFIKKATFSLLFNLTKAEKVPFVKAVLSKLSSAEIHEILESIAKQ